MQSMDVIVGKKSNNYMMSLTIPTDETIAAIATAVSPGEGAIAIVKVSGPLAKKVVSTIVRIPGNQEWKSHSILY